MANTVPAPVSNRIALAETYLPLLDEAYITGSRTAILDTVAERVRFTGANTVNIFTVNTVGMGNYDRNAGYVPGDVSGIWTPYVLETDRGRSYQIDALDQEESLSLMVDGVVAEANARHIIPEVDAYRFAQYAGGADASQVVSGTIATGADAVAAIDTATEVLDDGEVPYEGRILFVSASFYKLIKNGVTRMVENGEDNINRNVWMFDDMRIITVPQKRFSTGVTLAAPSASSDAGGYTASGDNINFMIVHPSAVLQVMKYFVPRLFTPAQNVNADAYLVQPRFEHGAWVKSQKANGIYVHHA